MKSLSRAWLLATPWLQPIRLLRPWDFPGKSNPMVTIHSGKDHPCMLKLLDERLLGEKEIHMVSIHLYPQYLLIKRGNLPLQWRDLAGPVFTKWSNVASLVMGNTDPGWSLVWCNGKSSLPFTELLSKKLTENPREETNSESGLFWERFLKTASVTKDKTKGQWDQGRLERHDNLIGTLIEFWIPKKSHRRNYGKLNTGYTLLIILNQ